MKNEIRLRICAMIIFLSLFSRFLFAQFNTGPGGGYGRTNPTIQAIGIGTFPNLASVQSILHINSNLTKTPTFISSGEVFRTDAPAGLTAWRMFRGGAEQFALYNPANTSNVILQATQGNLILKDAANQVTLAELIELKKEVQELKTLLAGKN